MFYENSTIASLQTNKQLSKRTNRKNKTCLPYVLWQSYKRLLEQQTSRDLCKMKILIHKPKIHIWHRVYFISNNRSVPFNELLEVDDIRCGKTFHLPVWQIFRLHSFSQNNNLGVTYPWKTTQNINLIFMTVIYNILDIKYQFTADKTIFFLLFYRLLLCIPFKILL